MTIVKYYHRHCRDITAIEIKCCNKFHNVWTFHLQ